jgi:uncharacterized protein with PIN domain
MGGVVELLPLVIARVSPTTPLHVFRFRDRNHRTIFERCKQERRALVTTSTKLLLRKDCPPGAYFLDVKSLANPERTLVHLLLSHGVVLEPHTFLSRCVFCNGKAERVHEKATIQAILASHPAPDDDDALEEEEEEKGVLKVSQCSACAQGYWWYNRPTSSASRVKNQAIQLLELCIRSGVPIKEDDMAMFDFVDAEQVKPNCPEGAEESLSMMDQRIDVLEWLQEERLENPLGPMRSAYASNSSEEESLSFTNVTAGFVGHLDYLMFQDPHLKVIDRLYVPTAFEELSDEGTRNGHLLPSNVWPSDHLAVGARFAFTDYNNGSSSTAPPEDSLSAKDLIPKSRVPDDPTTLFCSPVRGYDPVRPAPVAQTAPVEHAQRCACGCVPKILSLFEMAELRKQARLKRVPGNFEGSFPTT